jgi:hypothetical protein
MGPKHVIGAVIIAAIVYGELVLLVLLMGW